LVHISMAPKPQKKRSGRISLKPAPKAAAGQSGGSAKKRKTTLTKAKERDSGKAKQKPTKQKAAGAMGGYLEFCAMLELPVVDVESLKSFATYKSHDEEYEVEKNGENYILEGAGISIRSVFQIFEALRYGTTMMTDNNEATAKESFTQRQWARIGSHYATLRDLRAVLFEDWVSLCNF
jgi:hypothetical protein